MLRQGGEGQGGWLRGRRSGGAGGGGRRRATVRRAVRPYKKYTRDIAEYGTKIAGFPNPLSSTPPAGGCQGR